MSEQTPQDKVDAVVAQRHDRLAKLREVLGRCTTQLQQALPKGAMAEQFVRILMTTVQKTPKLQECSDRSIIVGAFEAAALGLLVEGVLGHAYLIPYKIRGVYQALLQVGARGFVQLAHQAGVGLCGGAARQHDMFEYEEGSTPFVRLVKRLDGDRGELIAAFGIARPYGHPAMELVRVLTKDEVLKRRDVSRTAGRDDSPWVQWPDEMWLKTGIRATAKQVPQSSQLQRIAAADEQRELGIGGRGADRLVDIVDVDIPEVA
jgi:recombination protein RecT